jgi:hypothetical protein
VFKIPFPSSVPWDLGVGHEHVFHLPFPRFSWEAILLRATRT